MNFQPREKRFERIKADLTDAIVVGTFSPGDTLPSMRDLAEHFHVSLGTVQRAAGELKDEGWLVSSARSAIAVADPLPPIAHLMGLKRSRRSDETQRHDVSPEVGEVGRNGRLTCLITDEAQRPLFEWAAREYADAYAPCALEVEMEPLPGREDEESMRRLDADLALLPSYAVNRAAMVEAITPSEGMLVEGEDSVRELPDEVLDIVSMDGKLWAVPVMANGPVLVADEGLCQDFGVDPDSLTDFDRLLDTMERTVANGGNHGDARLFNLTFVRQLLESAGHAFTGVPGASALMERADVRGLLERFRTLASNELIAEERFDRWDRIDFANVAIRHQPARMIPRRGAVVLPVPESGVGKQTMTHYCMCVSSRCVHVFEAWEWAAKLAGAPFQERLAEMGYDLPVSQDAGVWNAVTRVNGERNATTLKALSREVSPVYGMGRHDAMSYLWEVLGHEIHRFITGQDDYDRMLERVRTKTERFLRRARSRAGRK